MNTRKLLLDDKGNVVASDTIRRKIIEFKSSYKNTTHEIIQGSNDLDEDGEVFVKCTARVLSSFGMTRGGPFKGVEILDNGRVNHKERLLECWNVVGDSLIGIRNTIHERGYSRDRYLLELNETKRDEVIDKIWSITKQLLPLTMGQYTYGLVGASKILFAVLPEIVLPVDNEQWLRVFKTVDIGDILSGMVCDIQHWENKTGEKLNDMDKSKRLTTLPSVYNVIAMDARP